jgi:anti-sigma factor RsiW
MTSYTCQDVIDRLLGYTEGELQESERRLVEEHLLDCKSCADFLTSYRALPRLFGDATNTGMSDELRAKLKRVLTAKKREP